MTLVGKVSNGGTDFFLFTCHGSSQCFHHLQRKHWVSSFFARFSMRGGLGLRTNVTVEMPFGAKRRKLSNSVANSVRLGNVGIHFPLFNQPKARCEVCSKQNIESRRISKCSFCGINLCCKTNKNCFTTYHTQKLGVARFLRFHVCPYSLCYSKTKTSWHLRAGHKI